MILGSEPLGPPGGFVQPPFSVSMNKQELLNALETSLMLDEGALAPTSKLSELETWDSMAVLEFQALADENFGKQIDPTHIAACNTVEDLCVLVSDVLKD